MEVIQELPFKHKRKEINLEGLIVKLRVEEDNRNYEKKASTSHVAKENIVEHNHDFNAKTKNSKTDKGTKLGLKGGISKRPKFQVAQVPTKPTEVITKWVISQQGAGCLREPTKLIRWTTSPKMCLR